MNSLWAGTVLPPSNPRFSSVRFAACPTSDHLEPESLLQDSPRNASVATMKKPKARRQVNEVDQDTMRPEYDFSKGVRGVTAARYREGTNVIVLDPSLMDVFPDSAAVNEALRALAPVLRRRKRAQRPVAREARKSLAEAIELILENQSIGR